MYCTCIFVYLSKAHFVLQYTKAINYTESIPLCCYMIWTPWIRMPSVLNVHITCSSFYSKVWLPEMCDNSTDRQTQEQVKGFDSKMWLSARKEVSLPDRQTHWHQIHKTFSCWNREFVRYRMDYIIHNYMLGHSKPCTVMIQYDHHYTM